MSIKKRLRNQYNQGMKAGAAPYKKKYEQISNEIRENNATLGKIRKGQRKTEKIIDSTIDGMRKIDKNVQKIQEENKNNKKNQNKQQKKLVKVEKIMPTCNKRCSACGSPMSSRQLVCYKCGEISNDFSYDIADEEFDIKNECAEVLKPLGKIIKDSNKPDESWLYQDELEDKLIKLKKIHNIAKSALDVRGEENVYYKKIFDLTNKFFNDYSKKKLEIAVVGTVKAGKSSLINSLIGKNLASVDATPETSILVKYRTTAVENYLHIKFYTERQWSQLWESVQESTVFLNEYNELKADKYKETYLNHKDEYISCTSDNLQEKIMEWSRSDSPLHFFVKEIEVGYCSDTIPHDVYLVDTPGLSDPVKYRSNITKRYIRKSDWVLACIVGENLSCQPEMHFLGRVLSNKNNDASKLFVVATKKDTLTEEESRAKAKDFLIRLGELINNREMAISRFTFVAAECHYLTRKVMRGEELTKEERKKLRKALTEIDLEYDDINSKYDEILKYAGIDELFSKVTLNVLEKRREYIIRAINDDYDNCVHIINENATNFIDDASNYLEKLTTDREISQDKIEDLAEENEILVETQKKIQEIKNELEAKINEYEMNNRR